MGKVPKVPGTYTLGNGRRIRRFADGHVEFLPGEAQSRSTARSTAQSQPERRRKKAKPKPKPLHVRVWKWAKKHPAKATASVVGLGVVAHPDSRRALVGAARTGTSTVVSFVKGRQ
ncbi:MAG TPA: hypothetical protein VM286_05815 [Candidatus Thermoplasmatota archaeon]|nr:hypothetical protein [Candidatus Thermoplasmatota archaeon]